jgi:hypothetical protein
LNFEIILPLLLIVIYELSSWWRTNNMLRSTCMLVVHSVCVVKVNSNTNTSSNISSWYNMHLQWTRPDSSMPLFRGPTCFNWWTQCQRQQRWMISYFQVGRSSPCCVTVFLYIHLLLFHCRRNCKLFVTKLAILPSYNNLCSFQCSLNKNCIKISTLNANVNST